MNYGAYMKTLDNTCSSRGCNYNNYTNDTVPENNRFYQDHNTRMNSNIMIPVTNNMTAIPFPAFTEQDMDYYDLTLNMPFTTPYGYDRMENMDRDCDYMKQMYPSACKTIQKHVEDACDQLEYDGSCMFDESPDRVHLSIIINIIFDKVKYLENLPQEMEVEQLECDCRNRPGIPYRNPCYCDDGRPNWLRSLTEIMFLNEIQHRRRRYRGRKRWY